jgi:hypothetical protein
MLIDVLGYVAAVAVLAAYFLTAGGRRPIAWFHWANAIGCLFTGVSAAQHGAWPSFLLTMAFGAIGAYGLAHRPVDDSFLITTGVPHGLTPWDMIRMGDPVQILVVVDVPNATTLRVRKPIRRSSVQPTPTPVVER